MTENVRCGPAWQDDERIKRVAWAIGAVRMPPEDFRTYLATIFEYTDRITPEQARKRVTWVLPYLAQAALAALDVGETP